MFGYKCSLIFHDKKNYEDFKRIMKFLFLIYMK